MVKGHPTRLSSVLRETAECLDTLGSTEIEIEDMTLQEETLLTEGKLAVELTVALSLGPTSGDWEITGTETDTVTFRDDGTLSIPMSVEIPAESTNSDGSGVAANHEQSPTISSDNQATSADSQFRGASENGHESAPGDDRGSTEGDGKEPDEALPDGEESDPSDDSTSPDNGGTNKPVYRDADRLRSVYDRYDTFGEMTEALDVDVTPQTVRRYMIKHDIHDPSPRELVGTGATAETTESSSQSTEESVDDEKDLPSTELPADVTITGLTRAIQQSRTIRETSQRLDHDVDATRELLKELDLLDLVMGRIDSNGDREVSAEDIEERIRAA